jgi:hypothetical protein
MTAPGKANALSTPQAELPISSSLTITQVTRRGRATTRIVAGDTEATTGTAGLTAHAGSRTPRLAFSS